MPKNKKRSQAQDPQSVDQMQGGYGGYTQTGYDDFAGYEGYGSGTYDDGFYYDDDQGHKKRGAGFYIGMSIIAIALVAGLAVGTFLFMSSTQIIPTHRSGELGQLDGKTKEEIEAELNRIVEEGMFNIAIANVVQLANGSAEGDFSIENSPANRYNMQVTITLADTGEQIYESGIIEPNFHVQYAKLDTPLSKGTYNCIATFHALDPEKNDEEVGQAAAAMTIIVLN